MGVGIKQVDGIESFMKILTIVPLMVVIGNHLGSFLPYTLTCETRPGTRYRLQSALLLFGLVFFSIIGQIDYSFISKKISDSKALWVLFDFVVAVFATLTLLAFLRFINPWMYALVFALLLITFVLFYAGRNMILQNNGKYDENSEQYKLISIIVPILLIITFISVVVLFLYSYFQIRKKQSLFDKYIVFKSPADGKMYRSEVGPIGVGEYLFNPPPMKNCDEFVGKTSFFKGDEKPWWISEKLGMSGKEENKGYDNVEKALKAADGVGTKTPKEVGSTYMDNLRVLQSLKDRIKITEPIKSLSQEWTDSI